MYPEQTSNSLINWLLDISIGLSFFWAFVVVGGVCGFFLGGSCGQHNDFLKILTTKIMVTLQSRCLRIYISITVTVLCSHSFDSIFMLELTPPFSDCVGVVLMWTVHWCVNDWQNDQLHTYWRVWSPWVALSNSYEQWNVTLISCKWIAIKCKWKCLVL